MCVLRCKHGRLPENLSFCEKIYAPNMIVLFLFLGQYKKKKKMGSAQAFQNPFFLLCLEKENFGRQFFWPETPIPSAIPLARRRHFFICSAILRGLKHQFQVETPLARPRHFFFCLAILRWAKSSLHFSIRRLSQYFARRSPFFHLAFVHLVTHT